MKYGDFPYSKSKIFTEENIQKKIFSRQHIDFFAFARFFMAQTFYHFLAIYFIILIQYFLHFFAASTSEGEPITEQKMEAENSSSGKEENEEEKMSSQDDDHEQVKRKPSKSSEDEDGDGGSKNDPNPNIGHPPPQPDSTTGSVETKSTDGTKFHE